MLLESNSSITYFSLKLNLSQKFYRCVCECMCACMHACVCVCVCVCVCTCVCVSFILTAIAYIFNTKNNTHLIILLQDTAPIVTINTAGGEPDAMKKGEDEKFSVEELRDLSQAVASLKGSLREEKETLRELREDLEEYREVCVCVCVYVCVCMCVCVCVCVSVCLSLL